ncbi:MAG TPA: UDP-N-acetylmuramoyl-tripeptide--D-alanyl-D-alanine ligase [Candidatus Saccharimonadales bacterium]|nr:UDP-N-acetylmuramoyl-tripeptide--D-alanyl-D-alanine ligase [Candidatus Saccharimonadales bacterium]
MSPLVGPLVALAALVWLVLVFRIVLVAARMFQIEEYESVRFLRWGLTRDWLAHRAVWLGLLVGAVALSVAAILPAARPVGIAIAWLVSAAAAQFTWRWTSPKRPLVMTARMRRLLIAGGFLAVLLAAGLALGIVALHPVISMILVLIAAGLVTGLSEILLVAANVVTKPAESRIRRHYLALASARLKVVDPTVVAVTGSFGKTSTKHILAQLLQTHVNTLPTRKSFNTLMGVTRVINEDLMPENRIFIVEMDAYAPGEIAALSNLVHPRLAIITAIGPQHMERFGTLDKIAGALYEVATALPADGTLILYTGDESGAALALRARAEQRRLIRYALASNGDAVDADVVASAIRVDARGASFRWRWRAEGLDREVTIPLLGRHQVANVSAALAAVVTLGYSIDHAIAAAASLQQVEHRLQLMASAGPLTVIDDSYNANPVGVHDGLEVLAAMSGAHKFLVTPGLVELGSVENDENRRYGEHAANVCAHVIVMSAKTSAALCAGLRAGGMTEDRIHVVETLDAATRLLQSLSRPGDVVLFANDLPDTYLPAS